MKLALMLVTFLACSVLAGTIPVPDGGRFHRVLYFGGGDAHVDEVLPVNGVFKIIMLLYLDDPCPLPVVNADNMRKYQGASGNGCWYATLGGGFTVLLESGYEWNSPGLKYLNEGLLNENNRMLMVSKVNALSSPATQRQRDCHSVMDCSHPSAVEACHRIYTCDPPSE